MKHLAQVAFLAALLVAPQRADAAFTITFAQVGNDVVATGTGSFITDGLFLTAAGISRVPAVSGTFGFASVGSIPAGISSPARYEAFFSGAAYFGRGNYVSADSWTGDVGGLSLFTNALYVPYNYSSGTPILDSTAVYRNKTLASLGIAVGSYTYNYTYTYSAIRGGAAIDTFSIVVPPSVPEPASLVLLLVLGLIVLCTGAGARQSPA